MVFRRRGFFSLADLLRIERPGYDRVALMIESSEVFNKVGLGFQLEDRMGVGQNMERAIGTALRVQQKRIGKFSGPDPVQAALVLRKDLREFTQQFIEVAEESEIRLVQIS